MLPNNIQQSVRGQGNLHNVFSNSRRVFGLENELLLEERVRGSSLELGPLRDIFGDC
jgi:hypothetical protein